MAARGAVASAVGVVLGVGGLAVGKVRVLVARAGQLRGLFFCCGGWLTWLGKEGTGRRVYVRVWDGEMEEASADLASVELSYWKGPDLDEMMKWWWVWNSTTARGRWNCKDDS